MKMEHKNRMLSYVLSMMLIFAMALFITGCGGAAKNADSGAETGAQADSVSTEEAVGENDQADGVSVLGEGNTVFPFTVVDGDGNETKFEIHTDKETVGEALEELNLIAGDESEYGLYVKTVNGITADYDADGVYWAFYVNGEYAETGVDSTRIAEGESYSFKVEKG